MKNKLVRFGVLAALLGAITVQGAKIKQGDGFLAQPQQLAQTGAKCDIDQTLQFGGSDSSFGEFQHGVFQSNSAEAVVAVANEQEMYHDHQCFEAHDEKHCDQSLDSHAGQGCGVRKKTTVYSGEITYRDQKRQVEEGLAREWGQGCEQTVTNVYQQYGSLQAPVACVEASVCPQ